MSNQFDTLLEGQKKAMEFWSKLSDQMTKPFQPEQADPAKAGEALFQEWYTKQQAFFQEAMKGNPQDMLQQTPEHLRKYMQIQTEFTQKWADFFKSHADKMGFKIPGTDSLGDAAQYFQDNMSNWKQWMGGEQDWFSAQVLDKMPFNMRPHYTGFLDSYKFMSKYWEPLQRLIKNGLYDSEIAGKYFGMEPYQKLVNQMMGFRPVGNASDVVEQVNKWFSNMMSYMGTPSGDWKTVSESWKAQMDSMTNTGQLPFFEMAAELNNRLRDQLAPFNNIAAQGRETEISKTLQDIQFHYIAFVLKSAEMQAKVYESGQFAMPDTLRGFAEQYQKESQMPDLQTFLQAYLNKLEDAVLKVLHTDEYSKLQSEVSALAVGIKRDHGRLMELMYADLPFLTHTEGDDIAMEAAALRTKVRALEHRLAALEKAMPPSGESDAEKKATAAPVTAIKALMDKIGTASASDADDLKRIKGVGPKLESMLNDLGVYTLKQVAKMGTAEYDKIDELLGTFQGRAKRDHWARQAKALLK
ncbi:MAG: hypothetical protein RIC19_06760 [Phaeodactylibacter sp.]|uniref:hypothetical protein n=1 Tax=Phaeodactylibacter sp. TaxID=1940289 RepID=UPI0032EFB5C9